MAARAVALCEVLLFEEPTAETVARVLREHGEADPIELNARDLEELRAAAGRLIEVFGADSPDAAARLLNRILADVAQPPRLTSHNGTSTWHVHVSDDDGPWGEWFLASSAMALAVLLADHQRLPGGRCASPSCRRPYLDTGGGSPRRYCTSRCATRERVAAHRAGQST